MPRRHRSRERARDEAAAAEAAREAEKAEARREVLRRYCRLHPSGGPVFCSVSRAELEGLVPRRGSPGTDGRPIFDTRENAEAAARALEGLGSSTVLKSYTCMRSPTRHHLHLTTDTVATRERDRQRLRDHSPELAGGTHG